jgi:hypothetical protein
VIPSDCIAGPSASETRFALHYFKTALGARVHPGPKLRLRDLNRS